MSDIVQVSQRRGAPSAALRFRRALALCAVLGAALCAPASGQEPRGRLASVAFEGNETVSAERLLQLCRFAPEQTWSRDLAQTIAERLVEDPDIDAVLSVAAFDLDGDQVGVRIRVRETPRVGAVSFSGYDAVSLRRLRELDVVGTGDRYHDGLPDEIAAALTRFYQAEGFLLATVVVRVSGDARRRLDVDIKERLRVRLEHVTIRGSKQLNDEFILRELNNQPRRFFGVVSRGRYRPDLLVNDLEIIQQYYLRHGFTEVVVGFDGLRFDKRRNSAELRFRVREGRRFRFGGAHIEGSPSPATSLDRGASRIAGGWLLRWRSSPRRS